MIASVRTVANVVVNGDVSVGAVFLLLLLLLFPSSSL